VEGGSSTIRAVAYDETLNPLANIPVTFTTDAGQLDSGGSAVLTGADGVARDRLQTVTTAQVTASSGTTTASITINVANNDPPTAQFVFSPASPKTGEKVIFNAETSSDSDGDIISYEWNFGDGKTATGITTDHKYKNPGSYSVVLVVRDDSGNQASAGQTVTVTRGDQPVASFVYSPTNPRVDETIHFNASQSSDPDSDTLSYQWDFGDGNSGEGKTLTHSYSSSGSYTVLLVVTDDDGNTGAASQTINISSGESPTANFNVSPASPKVDELVSFNASDSSDPDDSIVSYQWDFGDGATASGMIVTHRFSSQGTFSVTLMVTDESGNSDSAVKTVTVSSGNPPDAQFSFSPSNPKTGDAVIFNAEGSSDGDGHIVRYDWSFGDGATATGETVSHVYTSANSFRVTLTVTDNDGNKDTREQTVTVGENQPPTALFVISPTSGKVGDTINFNASQSSDPDSDTLSYQWDFGDGNTGAGVTTSHTYTSAGTYSVVLTVTDDSGNTASTSRTITIDP
jgi:PKD repeat protein